MGVKLSEKPFSATCEHYYFPLTSCSTAWSPMLLLDAATSRPPVPPTATVMSVNWLLYQPPPLGRPASPIFTFRSRIVGPAPQFPPKV